MSEENKTQYIVRVCEVRAHGQEWPVATAEISHDNKMTRYFGSAGKAFGPLLCALQFGVRQMVAENLADALQMSRDVKKQVEAEKAWEG